MSGEGHPEDPTETLAARISAHDLARLDQMAARRGVARTDLISQAIDAMLAQEAWSGGFIPAPPPMRIPARRSPARRPLARPRR